MKHFLNNVYISKIDVNKNMKIKNKITGLILAVLAFIITLWLFTPQATTKEAVIEQKLRQLAHDNNISLEIATDYCLEALLEGSECYFIK